MTDIVERLRIRQPLLGTLCDEAADEIERLRDDYSILKQDYDALRSDNLDAKIIEAGEIEHLRTTLGYLADNIDNPALVAVAEAALKPKP